MALENTGAQSRSARSVDAREDVQAAREDLEGLKDELEAAVAECPQNTELQQVSPSDRY